jgi:LuxR family maltose regulon positive regulatory protein
LQALAADSQEVAVTVLMDALQHSQPDGFLRVYADNGRDLIPLLQEAARGGVHPLYVGEILAAIGDQASPKAGRLIESASGLVEALSPRELEVLRLMELGFQPGDRRPAGAAWAPSRLMSIISAGKWGQPTAPRQSFRQEI